MAHTLLTLWLRRFLTVPRGRGRRPASPDGLRPAYRRRLVVELLEDRLPPNNLLAGGFSPFLPERPFMPGDNSAVSAPASGDGSSLSGGGASLVLDPSGADGTPGGNRLTTVGGDPGGGGSPSGPDVPPGSSGTNPADPGSGAVPGPGSGGIFDLPSAPGDTSAGGGSSSANGAPFSFDFGLPPLHGHGHGRAQGHGHRGQRGHGHGHRGQRGHRHHGHPGRPAGTGGPAAPPQGGGSSPVGSPPQDTGTTPRPPDVPPDEIPNGSSPRRTPPPGTSGSSTPGPSGGGASEGKGTGSGPTASTPATPPPFINVGPIADATKMPGNQSEVAIAVDPTNPNRLFIGANENELVSASGFGMIASWSDDGGVTWHSRLIGDGTDNLPPALSDPTVAWDQYGNLFYAWVDGNNLDQDDIVMSTDGGQTFTFVASIQGRTTANVLDQPSIAVGPGANGVAGSIWLTADDSASFTDEPILVAGAPVTGLGQVGAFSQTYIQGSIATPGAFGDIAVGPKGQVLVYYQTNAIDAGGNIYASSDPKGLASLQFSNPVVVTSISTARFGPNKLPAMPDPRASMKGAVQYDRSPGPHNGRAYIIYSNDPTTDGANVDVFERYSDNNGASWSAPVRVTDDPGSNTKYMPRIAVDQTTGTLAASWYDARNATGNGGPGNPSGKANSDFEFFSSVSFDNGRSWVANIQLEPFASSAVLDRNLGNDYGDYTALAFDAGVYHPAWTDNSQSLAGMNPDGQFDIATIGVHVPQIASFSDVYEPDETSDKAHDFGKLPLAPPVIYENLQIANHANGLPDYDWFRWTAGTGATFTARFGVLDGNGQLEMHLFTVSPAGALIELGELTTGPGKVDFSKFLSANVHGGQPILVEVKGAPSAPGKFGTGTYDLMIGLS